MSCGVLTLFFRGLFLRGPMGVSFLGSYIHGLCGPVFSLLDHGSVLSCPPVSGPVHSRPLGGLALGRSARCLSAAALPGSPTCAVIFRASPPGSRGGVFSGGPMRGLSLWPCFLLSFFEPLKTSQEPRSIFARFRNCTGSRRSGSGRRFRAGKRGPNFRSGTWGLGRGRKNRGPIPVNQPPVSIFIPPLTGATWAAVALLFVGVSTPHRYAAVAGFYCWKKGGGQLFSLASRASRSS